MVTTLLTDKAIERGFSEPEGQELVGDLGLQPVDFDLEHSLPYFSF